MCLFPVLFLGMYGRRKSYRKGGTSTGYRRSGYSSGSNSLYAKNRGRSKYVKQKVYRRLNKKETKYDDDYYNLNAWTQFNQTGSLYTAGFTDFVLGGVVKTANVQLTGTNATLNGSSIHSAVITKEESYGPNCLTNVDNGTTAFTRIGNVISPKFLTLKGVITAAQTKSGVDPETVAKEIGGVEALTLVPRYCRTSVKIMVVRDKNMNEKGFVEYSDIFAPPTSVTAGMMDQAAVNPFIWNRKLDTLGRYEILRSMEWTLDQTDPQKSFTVLVPCMGIPIRFNGSANKALNWNDQTMFTDVMGITSVDSISATTSTAATKAKVKASSDSQSMTNGLYILAVAHCNSVDTNNMFSPAIVFSSRLSFDDA